MSNQTRPASGKPCRVTFSEHWYEPAVVLHRMPASGTAFIAEKAAAAA
jgi:hypothetical protein